MDNFTDSRSLPDGDKFKQYSFGEVHTCPFGQRFSIKDTGGKFGFPI